MLKLLLDEHISRAVAEGCAAATGNWSFFVWPNGETESSWDSQIPPV